MSRKSRFRLAAACVALAAVPLTGCGSSNKSPASQIRNVVNHYTVDVGQNNFSAACPLTAGALHSACELVKAQGGTQALASLCTAAGGSNCQTLAQGASAEASWAISKIVLSGSSATVAFTGNTTTMTLRKTGRSWRITSG